MTKIEYVNETWNPITGCSPISEGCQNCYAERMARRLAGRYGYPKKNPFQIVFHPERIKKLASWKKPRMIFVCSMGDLFHENVPHTLINFVMQAIFNNPGHIFLVLTKRPKNMEKYFKVYHEFFRPFKNLWLGITAENQKRFDERIGYLLRIQAAVHFVSVEPMLGPIELGLKAIIPFPTGKWPESEIEFGRKIDWIICGGETGPGARIMQPQWPMDLLNQCQEANIPFFFKSWGPWMPHPHNKDIKLKTYNFNKNLLNGQAWQQYPEI